MEKAANNFENIILFDGVCNLCNSSVNFIIDNDKNKLYRFTSLQSLAGMEILKEFGVNELSLQSVLLVHNGKLINKSTAALEIAKNLKFPYPLLFYVFKYFPKQMRDWVYDFIGKNRYKWFGKTEFCRVPTLEIKERFL